MAYTQWIHTAPAINNIAYHSQVVERSELYLANRLFTGHLRPDIAYKLGRRRLSDIGAKYSTVSASELVNALAEEYNTSSWMMVVDKMNRYQPDPKFNCAMAMINPFNSRLEWLTVKCDEKYSISTLICEKDVCINNQP